MPERAINVSPGVRAKLAGLGPAGRRWLDGLAALIDGLAAEWGFTVVEEMPGTSSGYLASVRLSDGANAARMSDGTDAVLKLAIPDGLQGNGPFAAELHTLLIAGGRGHVAVLRHDEGRRALLLERLGQPLGRLGLPVEQQVDILADTLRRGWVPLPKGAVLTSTVAKAPWLAEFIETMWVDQERPCPEGVLRQALAYCEERVAAGDPAERLLLHGDGHPHNVLEDPRHPGRFKLADPDGLTGDPAYDLAIPLRDWTRDLLAVGDPLPVARSWCARLGGLTAIDPTRIWQWAFIERVSTGLLVHRHGADPADGLAMLAVAGRLLDGSD